MTETVTIRRDDLQLLMDCAGHDVLPSEAVVPLTEALARCGEAMDAPAETAPPFSSAAATTLEPGLTRGAAAAPEAEPSLPDGIYARVELPGYRQHTGWVTEETRFGMQMAVIRDFDGRVLAEAALGPGCQVVHLPTPLKRPDPPLALEAGDSYEEEDDYGGHPF